MCKIHVDTVLLKTLYLLVRPHRAGRFIRSRCDDDPSGLPMYEYGTRDYTYMLCINISMDRMGEKEQVDRVQCR